MGLAFKFIIKEIYICLELYLIKHFNKKMCERRYSVKVVLAVLSMKYLPSDLRFN
jgi:hypothetical protein